MKKLFVVVMLAALGWSGYWWLGAKAQKEAFSGWLAAQQQRGWVAETENLTVAGYPNRFDTTFTGLELANPAEGWAWSAPLFQILALSYKPYHVIAVWPREHRVSTPEGTVTVRSDVTRGSIVVEPNTRLALDRSTIEIENMTLNGLEGWEASLTKGQFSTQQAANGTAPGFAHDIYLDIDDLSLPDALRTFLDRTGELPQVLKTVNLNMTAAFDAPWDRIAIEGTTPALTSASITNFQINWGALELKMRGAFDVRSDGYAEGKIDVTARNWKGMLRMVRDAGMISPDMAQTVERGLDQLSSDGRTLNITLVYQDGQTRIGEGFLTIPIGPAPRF